MAKIPEQEISNRNLGAFFPFSLLLCWIGGGNLFYLCVLRCFTFAWAPRTAPLRSLNYQIQTEPIISLFILPF